MYCSGDIWYYQTYKIWHIAPYREGFADALLGDAMLEEPRRHLEIRELETPGRYLRNLAFGPPLRGAFGTSSEDRLPDQNSAELCLNDASLSTEMLPESGSCGRLERALSRMGLLSKKTHKAASKGHRKTPSRGNLVSSKGLRATSRESLFCRHPRDGFTDGLGRRDLLQTPSSALFPRDDGLILGSARPD